MTVDLPIRIEDAAEKMGIGRSAAFSYASDSRCDLRYEGRAWYIYGDWDKFAAHVDKKNGWVYFIQCGAGGPIKVGTAKNVEHRLANLQSVHHETLTVITAFRGNVHQERKIHALLSEHRIRGEWFKREAVEGWLRENGHWPDGVGVR